MKAKREVALVMVTGNAFQILIDLKKKLLAILFVRQKGFNREGPVERVEIEELKRFEMSHFCTVMGRMFQIDSVAHLKLRPLFPCV